MNAVPVTETLDHLRRTLAQIDPAYRSINAFGPSLSLRVAAIDDALGGGLALGALHELAPALPAHGGAAAGFALALAALARTPNRQVLWIQSAFARTEAGAPYGLGLDCFGLPMDRVLVLVVARGSDVLWAMEEALKCRAVMAVIAEFTDDKHSTDLPRCAVFHLPRGRAGVWVFFCGIGHLRRRVPPLRAGKWLPL